MSPETWYEVLVEWDWPDQIEDGPDDPPAWELADLVKLLSECDA